MIPQEQIDKILENIFNVHETSDRCEELLSIGDISAVIENFSTDKTFKAYFLTLARAADFGVDTDGKDIVAISHLLGVDMLRMIIYSYFIFLKTPKQWKIFDISTLQLAEFNAKFLSVWNKLLGYLQLKNQRNLTIASYMLINIILCELVFSSYSYSFDEIISLTDTSYDKILQRGYDISLFDTACKAAGWDMQKLTMKEIEVIGYLKILLAYEFCQPEFYDFGFNKILDVSIHASAEMTIALKKALQR